MLTGHRPAMRRRTSRSRAARIAVPLAGTAALALAVGIFVAVSSGQTHNVNQAAFNRRPAPTAPASASASASASPSTSASASATVPPANSFASGAVATTKLGDVATVPVSGTGAAINTHQTAAEAANSMNCSLLVPADPLSARGLATPYQLGDGCSMENAGTEGAFVEATILAPNGSLQVYSPLVITAGTTPAVTPKAPTIAAGSVVEISIGFNGTNLYLTGRGAFEGNCVDALGQSVIGQVSACNAVNFYNAANADIARGTLKVPPLGTSHDGQPCLTTRDFATIDQDPSDNTVTQYLITANGQTAQNNPANEAALAGATTLTNGSDDALLTEFLDPSEGCTPFTAPDSTYPKADGPSQALDELQARVDQKGTIAVTPPNDEMVLVNGDMSIAKTNVYRSLVDQPLLAANTNPATVAASYCQNMVNIQPARNQLDYATEFNFTTPVPGTGDNLATFMANRLSMSFVNLVCSNYGLTNPVNVTLNGDGVATAATYNTAQQRATGAETANPAPFQGETTGTQAQGPRADREQDPSGM